MALDEDLDDERLRDLSTTGALSRLGDRLPDPVELVRLADLDALPRLGDRLPDPVELARLAHLDALCFEPRDCGA